jgi:YesN/AraC family two-component response regulator
MDMHDITELKNFSVLYVEDETIVRMSVVRFLRRRFGTVFEAENGRVGLALYEQSRPDLVITDIEMPVMGGMEMIRRIFELNHHQPIIITTGYNDDDHTSDKVCWNIIKPLDEEKLLTAILKCLSENNEERPRGGMSGGLSVGG